MLLALATALVLAAPPPEARAAEGLAAVEDEQVALYERISAGVVVISHGATVGTGFVVAPGLVLTAAHVVAGEREVRVEGRDGTVVRGDVLEGPGAELDLALVGIPPSPRATLPLSGDARPRTGNVVAAVGHGDGSRFSFSTGIVSNAEADGPGGALLRLQLPLRPGASGAPVVDRAGRVVGIVTTGGPGVAFAVRAPVVLRALEGRERLPAAARRDEVAELAWTPGEPLSAPRMIVGPADPRPVPPPGRPAPRGRGPGGQTAGARPTPK